MRGDSINYHVAAHSAALGASRYTGSVSWRHRIALLVLTVMTASPAAGAFCAMTCLSASDAAHHGAEQRCEDATAAPSGTQVGPGSKHDCRTHDDAVLSMATTPAVRADVGLTAPPATAETAPSAAASLVPVSPLVAYTPPHGTTPPTTTPLVLRV